MTTPVRVRIAPSPTGEPHVGTAYVGLFNWAWARKTGGRFILRIEDTDRTRKVPGAEEAILEALRWLGLDWDEGPDREGSHGPYRQSERLSIYQDHAGKLLESGAAYRCFCTAERLAELREQQKRTKHPPGYDGRCRGLSDGEVRSRLASGESHVVRLLVPWEGETSYEDLLRGKITFSNRKVDDQVLLKSDGFPTYHLANVVDDHLMGITHIIRGEEWLNSVPKHILIYRALGWEPPTMCHLPLLRNKDKSKVSKRKNPVSILWYRAQGYLPEAMVNFLALMGWSIGADREEFGLDEMVAAFDLKDLGTGGPVFDIEKLGWLNGVYIRKLPAGEIERRLHLGGFVPAGLDPDAVRKAVPLAQERMRTLSEFTELTDWFFADKVDPDPALLVPKKGTAEDARKILAAFGEATADPELPWTTEAIEGAAVAIVEREGYKKGTVFMTIRVAITGRTATPPICETMAALGRERTAARIGAAREKLEGAGHAGTG